MGEFNKIIDMFKAADIDKDVIAKLEKRKEEMGEKASYPEIMKEVKDILEEHLGVSLPVIKHGMGLKVSDEKAEFLKECTQRIKAFLDEQELRYRVIDEGCSICIFEFYLTVTGKSFRVRFYLEADIDHMKIETQMPFMGDKDFELLVCKEITDVNYSYRYGTFRYDRHDGEITYVIGLPIKGGIDKDILDLLYNAAVISSIDGYEKIRRAATGRINPNQISSVYKKIKRLINALKEDDGSDDNWNDADGTEDI